MRFHPAKIFLLLLLYLIPGKWGVAQPLYESYFSTLNGVIYKVDLNNCTADSIIDLHSEVFDIALSPGGKLYVLSGSYSILMLNLQTLTLQNIGPLGGNVAGVEASGINALVCDSTGNLISITSVRPNFQQFGLYYIDTLNASISLICPVDSTTGGDITYYQGDIYYDDEYDNLHRVTLNPVHDYKLGVIDCGHGGAFGLSTNVVDTVYCQPAIFSYSGYSICQVSPVTGNSTPWCPGILAPGSGGMSGAAAVTGAGCNSKPVFAMPNAFSPNNDGHNDMFYPLLLNGARVLEFRIYNRWGQMVHNSAQPWDGTFHSSPQPEGIYVYYIIISVPEGPLEQKTVKQEGTVMLLR